VRFTTAFVLLCATAAPALAQQGPTLSDQLDLVTGSISRQATDLANAVRSDQATIAHLQQQVAALTTQRDDLQKKLDAAAKPGQPAATAEPMPTVPTPPPATK
jgi:uncharacterized protein YlxW (UPF0749 family)